MTTQERMPLLRLESLSRCAPSRRRLLDRVTLDVEAGECLVLLGAPGSGRAALLRVIAGLDEPEEGRVLLEGRDITRLPPRRRPIGHLFQHDPLFGHATVFEAVASALPDAAEDGPRPPGQEAPGQEAPGQEAPGQEAPGQAGAAARVQHLLALVGLAEDVGSMPVMLPAGKRRRLTLARCLAGEPRLLLIGEGFGAPGGADRPAPRRWLREVQRRLGLAMILAAQDAEEALALADRIAVLEGGRVEQIGTPAEIRRRPASAAVARLLGIARATESAAPSPGPPSPGPPSPGPPSPGPPSPGPPSPGPPSPGPPSPGPLAAAAAAAALEVVAPGLGVPARVLGVTLLGATLRLELELIGDGTHLAAEVPSLGAALPPGSIVGLRVRAGIRPGGARLN